MVKYVVKEILPHFWVTFNGGICGGLRSNRGVCNISGSRTDLVPGLRCPTSGCGSKMPCHLSTAAHKSPRWIRHWRRSSIWPKPGALPVAVPEISCSQKFAKFRPRPLARLPFSAAGGGRLAPQLGHTRKFRKILYTKCGKKAIIKCGVERKSSHAFSTAAEKSQKPGRWDKSRSGEGDMMTFSPASGCLFFPVMVQ